MYDGWNLIQEQTTEGGSTTTDDYVWGLDLSGSLQGAGGIGGLLSKTNSLTSKTLYTFDANGNVGQLVDSSSGTIAAHYEYDPFGNLLVATGSEAANNVFRFSTKYYDAETDLYHYGYRYYSPKLGRWVNRDPIGEEGFGLLLKQSPIALEEMVGISLSNTRNGSQQQLLLYNFVQNDPVGYIDPYGLQAGCISCGPDVTARVDRTLQEVRKTYDKDWKIGEKWKACIKVYNILDKNHGTYKDAWDIYPLFLVGKRRLASIVWGSGVRDGTSPDCEWTVAYYGKCHNAGYLNFILWGVINQRCYGTFWWFDIQGVNPWSRRVALDAAVVWKLKEYGNRKSLPEVKAAVKAGYHASEGCPLEKSLYTHCAVDSSNRVPGVGSFKWVWEPIQHR